MFLTILAQAALDLPDWLDNLLVALITLGGIPTVSNAITGALRHFTDNTGLSPRWIASALAALVAAYLVYLGSSEIPVFPGLDAEPSSLFAWWGLATAGFIALQEGIYRILLSNFSFFNPN